jgi:hypothetical protein
MPQENRTDNSSGLIRLDLDQLLLDIWHQRRRLLFSAIVWAVIAVVLSLFFNPLFQAEITFLPVGSKQLAVFLKSRAAAKLVLAELPAVRDYLKVSRPTQANYAIELSRSISIRKPSREDQPYSLAVELANATMAAEVANAYMNLVASFVNNPEYDLAQRNTRFIKEQYDLYAASLGRSEDELRSFQEKHGVILLDSQTAATVGLVAQIEARLVKKEIELQALQTTPENPVLKKRANEIAALKDTLNELKGEQEGLIFTSGNMGAGMRPGLQPGLSEAPRLRLEHQRLRREVALAEQTCMHLQSQLTAARIQEEKEGISFMVIDRAIVPDKPSYPNRPLFAVVGAFLGMLFVASAILYNHCGIRINL